MAVTRHCRRGEEIYSHADPTDYWYRVVLGMARSSTLLYDGRRRIVDFLLPGNYFGFSVLGGTHNFDAEIVVDGTVIACYPRQRLEALADCDSDVARKLREEVFKTLMRLQARVLILGRTTAPEKVRAFLIEMGKRSHDDSDKAVVLPMSRYDIADYLAISVETVSRALTRLKVRGVITVADRHHLSIVDDDALEEAASWDTGE